MVTSKQIKEKIRDYRRSFKHSWNLFRESRIGMVGLVIMVIFVVTALISPYVGLRHPLDWWAPDDDILEIAPYFNGNLGVSTDGAFTHGLSFRMRPGSGTSTACDRMYAAGGYGTLFKPYGLYAYSQVDGKNLWNFNTDSPYGSQISTKVLVNNFGSETNIADAALRLLFGCENGRLFVLRDGFVETSSDYAPAGSNVWYYPLDGSVVGVTYYDLRGGNTTDLRANPFNNYDLFFASTKSGTLYAFRGPTPLINPVTGQYNVTQPTLLWTNHISNVSLSAPTVSETGQYVYVGTTDGLLYGIDVASGLEIPEWSSPYRISDNYVSTSPIAVGTPPIIYAATNDGLVHCIWGLNGTAKNGWTHNDNMILNDGFEVRNKRGDVDGGNFTDITMPPDGGYILVGSDTGFVYSINTKSVNVSISFDTKLSTQETKVRVAPYYDWRFSKYLFVTSTNLNGTATDPSDDFTVLFCIASPGNASVIWRKTFDGVMPAPVICFINGDTSHIGKADVVISTVTYESDGTATEGKMYSYSASGRVKTPLPPTWATSDKPASGNTYWLGTDSQGHDILSQTILGSRVALLVGFLSAFFSIAIGLIFGLVSGYYGKGIDAVLMRFTDVILVLPGLPLLITFAAIMNPSIWNIILIISLLGWGGVARVIRAEVLSLKERPFIDSARVTGASKSRIMFKHIAPNVLPLGLLYMTFAVGGAILSEASLAFIGLGDPGTMTWGMMLNYVQNSNALANWWWLLPPGICITLVCMAFFLVGRAFDEIVNPRLRRRR
jgi:peptide/nickel transport system permease protein